MATTVPIGALPLSLPFKPQIPVTPPPDCQSFPSKLSPPSQQLKVFSQEPFSSMETKVESQQAATTTTTTTTKTTTTTTTAAAAAPTGAAFHSQLNLNLNGHNSTDPAAALDPRYLAMVSRIAAYYQQRCQAVANYQHQRCQAWANMQRQKCQEMTQAAMLVVAWYVRDRIQRKRRRQKRQFRRGLSERTAGSGGVSKPKKSDVVRKWISHIPEGVLSASAASVGKPADKDELHFSMDTDVPPDKDSKLYSVADNLIKSQLSRIDVPLMGALSFDESESESDEEEMQRWRPDDEEKPALKNREDDEVGMDDDYSDDDDDDDYSYEDDGMEDYDDDNASGVVNKGSGTPKGSTSLES